MRTPGRWRFPPMKHSARAGRHKTPLWRRPPPGQGTQRRATQVWLAGLHALRISVSGLPGGSNTPLACAELFARPPPPTAGVVRGRTARGACRPASRDGLGSRARGRDSAKPCRPPRVDCSVAAAPVMNFLHQISGWAYALGLTRVQLRGANREAQWARRRRGLWPQGLAQQLRCRDAHAHQHTVEWMMCQARVLTHAAPHAAVVYALASATRLYVGVTGQCAAEAGRRTLGLPSSSGWQHFRDVHGAATSGTRHKRQAFGQAPAGTLAWWSTAGGTTRCMRAFERVLIRMLAPEGNSTHALVNGWRRQPEAESEGTDTSATHPSQTAQPAPATPQV